jgi:CNT family concentrative nucleoside transporter
VLASHIGVRLVSVLGIGVLIGLAWLMSSNRRAMPWRLVGFSLALQFAFAIVVRKTDAGVAFFAWLNDGFGRLMQYSRQGARFVLGVYIDREFTMALHVLPTIVFFSSLMAVLYHLGIMPRIVRALAWGMQRTLGTSGSETLAAAANIFVGQTEAPLVVKPFLDKMTNSELMALMVAGFASVAGGVMAAYVGLLHASIPGIAGHLISASVLSAPAGLLMAKVMVPETEQSETRGSLHQTVVTHDANVIDAAARGASEGLMLALNIGAMLVAFVGLVALLNAGLGWVWPGASLQQWLGYVLWPLAWLIGVPPRECYQVAMLLGEKTVLNEFVAYLHFSELMKTAPMSPRTTVITSYALCGFANLGSIAVQIGGISTLAPRRRSDLARLGLRAMVAGLLANLLTACIAGLLA